VNRKLLIAATIATGLALIALLGYSIERTQWLFSLFETWAPAAWAAAIVVELAAVALLIGAGALSALDLQARAWANRALVAVLSVQALANLTAGYLRGGRQALLLFGASDVPLPWLGVDARYAVAAALWFAVNLAVPGLILCLSKLAERLIAAAGTAVDLPLRDQVASLREQTANDRALLASTTSDLALARESEASARERLTLIEQQAANGSADAASLREQAANQEQAIVRLREQLSEAREQLHIKTTIAASEHDEAANLRATVANAKAGLANREQEIVQLRESLAEAREQIMVFGDTPPTHARVVAHVREQLARGRSLLDIARELGFSESTVRGWLKPATNGHLIEDR